ncbi:hypothetical protein CRX72_06160 [Pantoea sp. BRM17]|nr:hypothetical protein CRX72_06160 [Pantoea sp. BRM17]
MAGLQQPEAQRPLSRRYAPRPDWQSALRQLLSDLPLRLTWQDRARDIRWIERHLKEQFSAAQLAGAVVSQLRVLNGQAEWDTAFWLRVKAHYETLLPGYPRHEIAESFFNSVYCRLQGHSHLFPERLFIHSSQPYRR